MEDELVKLDVKRKASSVKMLIPLYLVILSFFILISIIISKDLEQSSLAMTIIHRSFGARPLHFFNTTQIGVGLEGTKIGAHEDKVWSEIIDLLANKLGEPTIFVNQGKSQITVEVAPEDVFGDFDHRTLNAEFEEFWQLLSNLLRSYGLIEGFQIEIEYGYRSAVGTYKAISNQDRAEIDFIATLFEKLDELSFIPSNLKVSFAQAEVESIKINFLLK